MDVMVTKEVNKVVEEVNKKLVKEVKVNLCKVNKLNWRWSWRWWWMR